MSKPKPWVPAELVALDARPSPAAFARFKLDDGGLLTVDRRHHRLDGPTMQAIAETAGVQDIDEGTGAFVKLRLDDEGLVRAVADMDGRNPIEIELLTASA
ncbi:hypothetical protein [Methylorubrum extorquens]|uniref:Uncharacterized protein n=1 Tax=Methylorubrum extorquens (strain ATCC 14718 / DSM 1338 / JCM 2805 / NCIMB 9133 / AM1) TaxID=272630 RepID=C5B3E4_METEA|nr:hypothetical protein [Methylorubrum extorquens]ACS42976.1 Hypothetical protein MexAM1_META2p0038 [Methylorubrum extorquens AM1]MCP1545986.1 hypothetical protein [Methylorubrum extorquens]MCP1590653.1 hypothetical protein [Methylorubrum extorquens]